MDPKMSTSVISRSSPYTPLSAARKEIRLLTIHPESLDGRISCSLKTKYIEDKSMPYDAVSYTWGPPSDQTPLIFLDSIAVPVRPHLLLVLRTLRARGQSRPFWIDALCINQEDTEEREQQIWIMDRIYRDARQVLAWLGEPNTTITDWLMQSDGTNVPKIVPAEVSVLRAIRELHKIKLSEYPQHLEKQTYAFRLLGLEYWSRLRIIQEVVLARSLYLLWGSDSMPWQAAKRVLEKIRRSGMSWASSVIRERIQRMTRLSGIMGPPPPRLRMRIRGNSLSSLLDVSYSSRCGDPRDKLYGILAIATSDARQSIPIDYSISVFEVYGNVIRFFLLSNDCASNPYASNDLIIFSQLLQRSLLGPDFAPAVLEQMGAGRRDWEARSESETRHKLKHIFESGQSLLRNFPTNGKRDSAHLYALLTAWDARTNCTSTLRRTPLKLRGSAIGKIVKIEIASYSTRVIEGAETTSFTKMAAQYTWDLDRECFPFFKDLVFQLFGGTAKGENSTYTDSTSVPRLVIFTTDNGRVGLAPVGIIEGDVLLRFPPYGASPFYAIAREQHQGFRICGRAHFLNNFQREDKPVILRHRPPPEDPQIELDVLVDLPILQVLTCPLRSAQTTT